MIPAAELSSNCVDFHGGDFYEEPPRPTGANVVMIVSESATGKTELSLDLADLILKAHGTESEIIAADKRTAHRGAEAIMAAPTPDEQARIPHHMVGVFDLFDHWVPRWTYQAMARACMRDVDARGRLPMVVSGSEHLMEALAFYPGFHHLGADKTEQKRLKNLSLGDLQEEAWAKGFAGPFENDPRRWRNYIMARTALQRPWDQPPHPGTLLLGVRRDPEERRARIAARLDRSYWQMVGEVDRLILSEPLFIPPHIIQTIGMGNFWGAVDMPEETREEVYRRTKQSILDQTIAFAQWQEREIRSWMDPHIRWVESAEEALECYNGHLQTLPKP